MWWDLIRLIQMRLHNMCFCYVCGETKNIHPQIFVNWSYMFSCQILGCKLQKSLIQCTKQKFTSVLRKEKEIPLKQEVEYRIYYAQISVKRWEKIKVELSLIYFSFSEIYKIVSQKQIRDSPDDENSPSNNVQTITVAPTDNSQSSKRPCCSL